MMPVVFMFLLGAIILQRLVELIVANANRKWAYERGGREYGESHYKWFIIVHTLFFISLAIESSIYFNEWKPSHFLLLFSIFTALQLFRVWCILSLGKYWNTRVIVIPGHEIVAKGPYRFFKHPNYWVVFMEFIIISLLFQAYATAIIFPVLHLLLLRVRIPIEEKALNQFSAADQF